MAKYVYPAVFTEEGAGGFSIKFPDVEGCLSEGETIEECMEMAEDALALMMYHLEMDGAPIPKPSTIDATKCGKGQFATYIFADTMEYRKRFSNRSVKKTVTLPEWLNLEAEKQGVNFSQVLQTALKDELAV